MLPISNKISLYFSIPLLLLGVIFIFFLHNIMHKHFEDEHIRWGRILSHTLSESIAEFTINRDLIQAGEILHRLMDQEPVIKYIYVLDFDRQPFAHTFDTAVPSVMMENFNERQPFQHYNINNESVIEVWSPLIKGMNASVHLGISTKADEHFINKTLTILLVLFVLLIATTLLIGALLGNLIGKPLEALTKQLRFVGKENTDLPPKIKSNFAEITDLGNSFNKMLVQRKEYISEIIKQRSSLNKAQEIAHVGNWDWNITAGTLHWSDEVYRIFGLKPQEFAATYDAFLERVHIDDRQKVIDAVNNSLKDANQPYSVEHRVVHPSGELRWVHEKGEVFFSDDKPVDMIGVVHDITEIKKAELVMKAYQSELEKTVTVRTKELTTANQKLQQLDKLKSLFIASMSHELRTPLNSIIGFTGVMLKGMTGELNKLQTDQLGRVHHSAKHLLGLISDIIDISKIEAGRVDIAIECVQLKTLVDDAVSNVKGLLEEKGIVLHMDLEADITLYTDRMRLLQVVLNILSNAAKYTERGSIKVQASHINDHIMLSVEDSGVGIEQDNLHKIFEPFERVENVMSIQSGGTGLGLYLTQKLLAEVLQGTISVQSEIGKGSCFTLTLPLSIGKSEQKENAAGAIA